MEDKDRLGDKLRDKGKAAEDLYIAQQERERLARRRAASTTSASATVACPRDGSQLDERHEYGVTIDLCPTCHGVWLDKGELEAILNKENEAGVTSWLRSMLGGR